MTSALELLYEVFAGDAEVLAALEVTVFLLELKSDLIHTDLRLEQINVILQTLLERPILSEWLDEVFHIEEGKSIQLLSGHEWVGVSILVFG